MFYSFFGICLIRLSFIDKNELKFQKQIDFDLISVNFSDLMSTMDETKVV